MTAPYRVEINDSGCGECSHGRTWWVIGPDEVASSTSYGDEEEAQSLKRALDAAYELGRKSAGPNPWTRFSPESPPPRSSALIVWDSEFGSVSSMFSEVDDSATLDRAAHMKYSHWITASTMQKPPLAELPEPTITIEPAPPPAPPVSPTTSTDWADDIPF